MRCEICNKSMTYPTSDGKGDLHWYCQDCAEEIETATFEMQDDDWFEEDLVSLDEVDDHDEETFLSGVDDST